MYISAHTKMIRLKDFADYVNDFHAGKDSEIVDNLIINPEIDEEPNQGDLAPVYFIAAHSPALSIQFFQPQSRTGVWDLAGDKRLFAMINRPLDPEFKAGWQSMRRDDVVDIRPQRQKLNNVVRVRMRREIQARDGIYPWYEFEYALLKKLGFKRNVRWRAIVWKH
jgi:hypothetical protein